ILPTRAFMLVRKAIEVSGIVQGVGFRPYIYRLASERQLAGSICNTAAGVSIEVQGPSAAVEDFLARLPAEAPPLARITGIVVREIACNGDRDFQIVTTHRGEPVRTLISPDVAVCADCLREMFEPADRRCRYPFINCTNCGPRFTIVRNIPYDRPFTSMAAFRMCPACETEYDDPSNRRFHAQPNACWTCGPQVELWIWMGIGLKWPIRLPKQQRACRTGRLSLSRAWVDFISLATPSTPTRCGSSASASVELKS